MVVVFKYGNTYAYATKEEYLNHEDYMFCRIYCDTIEEAIDYLRTIVNYEGEIEVIEDV